MLPCPLIVRAHPRLWSAVACHRFSSCHTTPFTLSVVGSPSILQRSDVPTFKRSDDLIFMVSLLSYNFLPSLPRRVARRHSHVCDEKQPLLRSSKTRSYNLPQIRDARNSFRIRSYANCRVSPALFLPFRHLSPLDATPMKLPVSVANKRLIDLGKPFRCNTYRKHDGRGPGYG